MSRKPDNTPAHTFPDSIRDSSLDAEASAIGSMLIDSRCVPLVMQALSPEDIYDSSMRTIFEAIRGLYLDRKSIDIVSINDRLGDAYTPTLVRLMKLTPTANNAELYCSLARDQTRLRRLSALGQSLIYARDVDAARGIIQQCAELLSDRTSSRVKDYSDIIVDYLDRQSDGKPPNYLKWDIEQLDRVLSISPGRFVILGADSSFGKTALALQFARSMALSGKRVGFFSLETSHADAGDRLLANGADIELPRSKSKTLSEQDITHAYAEGDRASKICLQIIEAAGATVEDIRSLTLARDYEVIFIDYVQIIRSARIDRWQAVTEVSMALHTMSQQLGVTVIALSQVTPPEPDKKGKRRALNKSDLRESRQLINDADAILMLDLYDIANPKGPRVLIVDKNKDGALGKVCLTFDPVHMRFNYMPPPPGEQYKKYNEEMARLRREEREAKREGRMPDQIVFQDASDNKEALPF